MPRRMSRELKTLSVLALSLALNGCIGFGGIGPKGTMLAPNALATDEAIQSAAQDANWPKAQWWNAYHAKVAEVLLPQLEGEVRAWVEAACAPL